MGGKQTFASAQAKVGSADGADRQDATLMVRLLGLQVSETLACFVMRR
jgi:hypothetical protein